MSQFLLYISESDIIVEEQCRHIYNHMTSYCFLDAVTLHCLVTERKVMYVTLKFGVLGYFIDV